MKNLNPFYSTPAAILAGALIVAVAILMNGGIIKFGKPVKTVPQAASSSQPSQAGQAKTEADIVNNLKNLAGQLNLDQGKFDSCLDSGEKDSLVKKDLDDGSTVGVNGTPAFFVNGRLLSGAQPFSEFKKVIDQELLGTASTATKQTVAVGDLSVQGQTGAKVTIIEFSDYQCPFCERFFTQTESQLKTEYIDKGLVKMYYRDYPLSQIHPGAQKAAEAARCAGDQNKYWEYHDLIFQSQQNIF